MSITTQNLIPWLLIITSVALVAIITYAYSNRNTRLTVYFTVSAILVIGFIKLLGTLSALFTQQFIGRYDELGVPYVYANPGWNEIISGWSIWILPVLLSIIITIIAMLVLTQSHRGKPLLPDVPYHPLPTTTTSQITERLNIDSLKSAMTESMEKLSEALLTIASQEIKISDLQAQLQDQTGNVSGTDEALEEEVAILKLENTAKNIEVETLTKQLEERTAELDLAHEMFEKLLQQKMSDEE